jgi:hypothetical protein
VKLTLNRIVAAGAVTAAVALGGVGYAYAQSSSDTTTPPATTAPGGGCAAPNDGGHSQGNCPNMGGSSSNQSSADASQTAYMHHGYGGRF